MHVRGNDRGRGWRWACGLASLAIACGAPGYVLERRDESEATSFPTDPTSSTAELESGASGSVSSSSGSGSGSGSGHVGCEVDGSCAVKVDLLFVIDNSGTMGEEQLNLARNFGELMDALQTLTDPLGNAVASDVHIMVTTTDMGNPACDDGFKPDDYEPQRGAPVATPCTDRIQRFTGRGNDPLTIESACLEVCDPESAPAPLGHFIHVYPSGDNIDGGTPAQALACIGPQGIDGCGFESPLEAMQQALNPCACWNEPSRCGDAAVEACEAEAVDYDESFLRDDAILAIVMITDEADCSVRDFDIMTTPTFMATDPQDGAPAPSSALCWNAGVVCGEVDPLDGSYSGCTPSNFSSDGASGVSDDEAVLHPTSRYESLLSALRSEGREVIMLGVLGVPEVTAYADTPPFQPIEGGVAALQYRDWRDPAHPRGDILPSDWDDGIDADAMQFEFGIGPGCTVSNTDYEGQAIPPARIRRVCESLDVPDDPDTPGDESQTRCCMESVCGEDFTPALRCLTGLIRTAIVPAS